MVSEQPPSKGRPALRSRLTLLTAGWSLALTACNGLPRLGTDSSDNKDGSGTALDGGADGDVGADQPGEVTGAFLTGCGPDTERSTSTVDAFGCGIYDATTGRGFAGRIEGAKVELRRADGSGRLPILRAAPTGSAWHVLFALKAGTKDQFTAAVLTAVISAGAADPGRAFDSGAIDLNFTPPVTASQGQPELVTVAPEVDPSLVASAGDDPGLTPDGSTTGLTGGGGDGGSTASGTGSGTGTDSDTGTGTGTGNDTGGSTGSGSLGMNAHAVVRLTEAAAVTVTGTCDQSKGDVSIKVGGATFGATCAANGTWTSPVMDLSAVLSGGDHSVLLTQEPGGGGTATGKLTRTHLLTVSPRYAEHGSNWLDYVTSGSDSGCGGAGESDINACEHAGELRQVSLAAVGQPCAELTFEDELGAFRWQCRGQPADQVQPLTLYSVGLLPGKHLSDLLLASPPSFRPNRILVRKSGVVVGESLPLAWWTNDVVKLGPTDVSSGAYIARTPANGGTLNSGTILIYDTSMAGVGIDLVSAKLALVGLGDAELRSSALVRTDRHICPMNGADTNTRCLVMLGGDYTWVEGRFKGFPMSGGQDSTVMVRGAFARLDHVRAWSDTIGVSLVESSFGRVTDLLTFSHNSIGLSLTNPDSARTSGHLLTGVRAINTSVGISIKSSSGNTLQLVSSASNTGNGFEIENSASTVITRSVAANNHGIGIRVAPGADSGPLVLKAITTVNNKFGGMDLNAGSNQARLSHIAGINNESSNLQLQNGTGLTAAVTLDHSAMGLGNSTQLISGVNNVTFTGAMLFQANDASTLFCSISGSAMSALTSGCSVLPTASPDLEVATTTGLATAFAGSLSQSPRDHVTIGEVPAGTGWLSGWGPGSSAPLAPGARGRCVPGASPTCDLWDWRLAAGSPLRHRAGAAVAAGAACPAYADPPGVSGFLTLSQSAEFLDDALEVLGDFNGDDDGLCEADESCFLTQHLGADQGQPAVGSGSATCVYPDSVNFGRITMYLPAAGLTPP